VADIVVVMDHGHIAQAGAAPDIYSRPRNAYVARFMGGHNVLHGTVTTVTSTMATLLSPCGERYTVPLPHHTVATDDVLWCSIRRDHLTLTKTSQSYTAMAAESNAICGLVQAIEYQGAYVKVTLQRPEHEDFVASLADSDFFAQHLDIGDRVVARWAVADVHLLETAPACTTIPAVPG
jgi:putative spermidine/putrescine transport system ATP-binding protein